MKSSDTESSIMNKKNVMKRLRFFATLFLTMAMLTLLNFPQMAEYAIPIGNFLRKLELSNEEDDTYHQRPVMHTFYDELNNPGQRITGMSLTDDRQLLKIWADSWKSMGYRVRILTMEDVQKHPFFYHIESLLQKVPLGRRPDYDRVCYLRWFAMATVGGGWMSDFDVIPLPGSMQDESHNNNILPGNGNFTVYDMTAQGDPVPSLMSGSSEEWDRLSNLILEYGMKQEGLTDNIFSDFISLIGLKESANIIQVDEVVKGHNILNTEHLITKQNCIDLKDMRGIHISHRAMNELQQKISERPRFAEKFLQNWASVCSEGESENVSKS